MTTEQFPKYGNSKHVKDINELLYLLVHSSKTVTINKQKAIEVRDYLMVSLTYFNCLSQIHLQQIKSYIENLRSFVAKDDKKHASQRFLFTSSRFSKEKYCKCNGSFIQEGFGIMLLVSIWNVIKAYVI